MIAPDNKAPFLLRNRSALFRNISKTHHASPHKSVPLRGLWFLSVQSDNDEMKEAVFPSPCRDYGSYLNSGTKVYPTESRFPSPYGDCGSYRYILLPEMWRNRKRFPSPYGDCGSYPNMTARFGEIMPCFRPLTGIVVLIRTLYKWLYEAVEMAFCGADHIFSSFFVFLQENDFQKIVWA